MSKNVHVILIHKEPDACRRIIGLLEAHFKSFKVDARTDAKDMADLIHQCDSKRLQKPPYDILIVGDDLIRADEIQFFHEIKNKWPEIPIVMITRDTDAGTIAKALKAGADTCIPGKDQARLLVPAVESVLRKSSLISKKISAVAKTSCSGGVQGMVLKNIHHRIKNNLQIISSLLNLGASYVKEDKALEVLEASRNRIKTIALVHDQLCNREEATKVDFGEYLKRLVAHAFKSSGERTDGIELHLQVDGIELDSDKAVSCGLILNELVSNSLRHAFPDGRRGMITIRLTMTARTTYVIYYSDNGIGLPEGMHIDKCETLGMQVIHMLISQLCGSLSVRSNGGCEFTIIFSQ